MLTYSLLRSSEAMAAASRREADGRALRVNLPDRIPHAAIFGSTGSMKTTAYAVPVLQSCAESMVVLDPKGELARLTARLRMRRYGHDVQIIDPFGVANVRGIPTARLNPISLVREEPSRLVDEARRLATAIVVRTGEEKDPFWAQISNTLVTATVAFLASEATPEEATLSRARDILCSPKLTEQMLAHMRESDACSGLLQRLAGQVAQLEGQTKASAYSVANSHIDFLDSLPVAETLSESTFDPKQLVNAKQTIYLCLPVDRVAELNGLQRVLLSTLINAVFAAGEDRRRKVRFLLDEAATLGPLDALYNAVFYGRSFGLRLLFLFQSSSQVSRSFPDSQKDDFFATVGSVFCGVNDHRTAKEVSDWIGQTTVVGTTRQDSFSQGKTAGTGLQDQTHSTNWGDNRSTSYSEVGRALIQPEEVLQLPKNAAIVLLPNVRPILAEKTPYFARRGRRLIRRTGWAVVNAVVALATAAAVGGAVWAATIGQDHPMVVELSGKLSDLLSRR
ncbi:type IV secretory system conjugative DNA transfer family protein [Posidoniimonas corsicana]|uniref:type IV secretory system conjugative DNA transfer family protein n=1 Tax=Posidoniimonas corsicana TaxID=1938618 RepID=UPI0018D358E0|nr:type IV secretory system conjugative DNA transfer family protein [Posidoniimonas corsicana]